MKKTRLLEIIREEIAGALNEAGLGDQITALQKQKDALEKQEAPITKRKADISKKIADLEKKQADAEVKSSNTLEEGEKRKKLAAKYQLDEETINEMASIKQLKSELEKQGKEKELRAVKAAEKSTLDALKSDPTITSDGRLKGYVSALKKELKAEHNIILQDLLTTVMLDAEEAGGKFKDDIATNTIEKDAANQLLGKEPGQRGRKADPNKPEKPASTGTKGRPAGSKKATLTPGDDGFDKVTYSDDSDEEIEDTYYNDEDEFSSTDTEGPSSKDISGDETAKELGSTPEEKKAKFNQFLASVKKNKEDKAKIDGILKLAKEKIKFPKSMMDDLKRAAGRSVE